MAIFKKKQWSGLLWAFISLFVACGAIYCIYPNDVSNFFSGRTLFEGRSANEWSKDLTHADHDPRLRAVIALGKLSEDSKHTISQLAQMLHDDVEPDIRAAAANSLGKMAPDSKSALKDLAHALNDNEPNVRLSAAISLCLFKTDARPIIPDLIAAVEEKESNINSSIISLSIRETMIRALGNAGEGSHDAVPVLTKILNQTGTKLTQVIAIRGLGLAGPHAIEAAPLLQTFTTNSDIDIKEAAVTSLLLIGVEPNGSVPKKN